MVRKSKQNSTLFIEVFINNRYNIYKEGILRGKQEPPDSCL